jgi:hypothetical protein|eukprot:3594508-Prymnesium_polylepis.2
MPVRAHTKWQERSETDTGETAGQLVDQTYAPRSERSCPLFEIRQPIMLVDDVSTVLRQVHPDAYITNAANKVVCSMVNGLFDRICDEALRSNSKPKLEDIVKAVSSTLSTLSTSDQVKKHALLEGQKAIDNNGTTLTFSSAYFAERYKSCAKSKADKEVCRRSVFISSQPASDCHASLSHAGGALHYRRDGVHGGRAA